MKLVAETDRLFIRQFAESDSQFIFTLLNSPGWLQFIGDRNIKTSEDARHYIVNGPLFSYLKFGFGPYLVELKGSKIPIGMCSLIKRETLEDVDLGFAFLHDYVAKGYAYEACTAVLNYSKNTLGLKKLVAITNQDNLSSIALLKKLDFFSEGTIKLPHEENDLFFFSHLL
ncbi:hypothetical protein CNR22_08185 [Sphingobacteriaceae bacterium]|nr:hypothetical protein CNR22_08185 [Sphingobacteriaceae bacterium]